MKTDCIFFEDTYEEIPHFRHCINNKTLYTKGVEDDVMCGNCRLWDSYIPESASDDEKATAIEWQEMAYAEQPDYEDYFRAHGMLN